MMRPRWSTMMVTFSLLHRFCPPNNSSDRQTCSWCRWDVADWTWDLCRLHLMLISCSPAAHVASPAHLRLQLQLVQFHAINRCFSGLNWWFDLRFHAFAAQTFVALVRSHFALELVSFSGMFRHRHRRHWRDFRHFGDNCGQTWRLRWAKITNCSDLVGSFATKAWSRRWRWLTYRNLRWIRLCCDDWIFRLRWELSFGRFSRLFRNEIRFSLFSWIV